MVDRLAALRRERHELLLFIGSLGPSDWQLPSTADGWRIQDVVAHMGSACRALFSPAAMNVMRGNDIEHANEILVAQRSEWSASEVLAEYERWSRRAITTARLITSTPLGRARAPLAELGRFPIALMLTSAMVFDHHTHLRHDIAPALDRPPPDTDAERMSAVLEWMIAVLSNQLRTARHSWLDRTVAIRLDGPGGGTWSIEPDGNIRPGPTTNSATQIRGSALEFPEWGTRRVDWRTRDIAIEGDNELATAFLDATDIV
ncbi:maleylpyruvate isomerase family mycothiol-dependent enzyme [Nocardia sp. NPDC055165]